MRTFTLLALLLATVAYADDLVEPDKAARKTAGVYFVGVSAATPVMGGRRLRSFRLTPMRLKDERLGHAPPIDVQAKEHWGHAARPALAVGGDELFVGRGKTLERYRPFGDTGATALSRVALGAEATALHARRGLVYAGGLGRVVVVDYRAEKPAERLITTQPKDRNRPVDFFVRLPGTLVGVDNILTQKFAYLIDVPRVRFRARAHLLDHVNGQLHFGAAVDAQLFVIGSFSGWGGAGYQLYRGVVSKGKASCKVVLRGKGETWTGIGELGGTLVIGAGTRGILLVDPAAPARPTVVDVGGDCRSLIVAGERVLTLVRTKDRTVLREYRSGDGGAGFVKVGEHPVPRPMATLMR